MVALPVLAAACGLGMGGLAVVMGWRLRAGRIPGRYRRGHQITPGHSQQLREPTVAWDALRRSHTLPKNSSPIINQRSAGA
ncbi:MAG: hypothetical protein ACRDZY_00025 [Acidimicrobiales bacterium]